MRPLYEIHIDYEAIQHFVESYASENGGEIPPDLEQRLAEIECERDQKILNVALFIKNLRSYSAAIKEEEKKLSLRRKPLENLSDRLEVLLNSILNSGETLKDSRVALSWRKSVSTEIVDPDSVPDQYVELVRKVHVEDIKRDLKAGAEYSFARLVEKANLQIK